MRFLRLLTNKFLIATAAFAVWMIFFDQNDLASIRERRAKLEDTKDHIIRLTREIEQMDSTRIARQRDPHALETYAREQYRMKRDGEDLYVVEEDPKPETADGRSY